MGEKIPQGLRHKNVLLSTILLLYSTLEHRHIL